MDPLTLAVATFGIQKLRGKSTGRSLRDAFMIGGLGQLGGMAGVPGMQAFGKASSMPAMFQSGNFLGGAANQNMWGQMQQTGIGKFFGLGPQQSQAYNMLMGKESGVIPNPGERVGGFFGKDGVWSNMSPGAKLGTGLGATVLGAELLGGEEEFDKVGINKWSKEDYKKAYDEQMKSLEGLSSYAKYPSRGLYTDQAVYDKFATAYNQGGLVAVQKFKEGGVSYLPSKISHDEKDPHNYIRAQGYVEDGSGTGDKDEDTMLAQLADGEFVSRADAILGAGIIEGADPKSQSDMRKKGAAFFYGQQKKFKRVFDLIDASRKDN
jgi:hypothetical protein